jgi:hypothetical protein
MRAYMTTFGMALGLIAIWDAVMPLVSANPQRAGRPRGELTDEPLVEPATYKVTVGANAPTTNVLTFIDAQKGMNHGGRLRWGPGGRHQS